MHGSTLRVLAALIVVAGCSTPAPSSDTTTTLDDGDLATSTDDGSVAGSSSGAAPATMSTDPATGDATTSGTLGDESGGAPVLPAPENVAAIAANGQVGLEWDLVPGATRYDLYWSLVPGVGPLAGDLIQDVAPGFVHEGRENGTALHYVVVAANDDGASEPSTEISAVPGGDFMLEALGTGRVDDIVTGALLRIPIEQRIHVTLLPEGYLESDLDVFEVDVDDWRAEVFAIDPYSRFSAAFVVWKLPLASAEHVAGGDPQPADTAFLVPVDDGLDEVGAIELDGPTAMRIWGALASFPYPPTHFYPADGATSLQAKTMLAHVLVFDPDDGSSGMSGVSRRVENPADPNQRLSVAFAHSRSHEFSHAFARLQDEYMTGSQLGENNASATSSAYVSNVVTDPTCDTLPWKHLLLGGAANPDVDELVGAFGRPETGYHSEFMCLMNGDHSGNQDVFGGDGELRRAELCNFCGELATMRLFERLGVLADPQVSLADWIDEYQPVYYERFGLVVPETLPQENSAGEPWFQVCTR